MNLSHGSAVVTTHRMRTIKVRDDAEIEYDVLGNGDLDLLLIPGAVVSDAFEPLLSELTHAPSNNLRVANFHRRGYGRSSKATFPFSIQDQAQDCLSVMDSLGFRKTHVVAHSMSGLIALQLASDVPERIGSLALIEPSLTAFIPSAPQTAQALSRVVALYQSGNKAGALDTFMEGVSGQEYRKTMDKVLPGWFENAVNDIDTFFQVELPSIREWKFSTRERVRQPVLSIYGTEKRWADTVASGAEFDRLLHSWFPQTESLPVLGAHHWPQITNTVGLAKCLTDFLGRTAG